MEKPTVYLDKGALSALNIIGVSDCCHFCYSEAMLLDMKSDLTQTFRNELDDLNLSDALYLSRYGNGVTISTVDGHSEFEKTNRFEVGFMAPLYGFLNGGGPSETLLGVFDGQISELSTFDHELGCLFEHLALQKIGPDDRQMLQEQKATDWRSQIQSQTRGWNQNSKATLKTGIELSEAFADALRDIIPKKPEDFESIQLAAMMLGPLHLGQDKGICSPNSQKAKKAAENGYIDCLHIAYGFYCDVFLTTDAATLRRYLILNEHWGLGKHGAQIVKSAPQGAFLY